MTARGRQSVIPAVALDALAAAAAGNAEKLAAVAISALGSGDSDRAYRFAREARALAPDDAHIAGITAKAIAHSVPSWHFHIVHDRPRNTAYEQALRRAIRPGDRVLDIGTGTGLLAMMAARAGAGQVIACEMNPAVADAATEIVALNGHSDRIRILTRHSSELDAEADLGGPVDVLVSEIIADNLLSESVLPVMSDVVGRLTGPGTRIIPARGEVRVALAYLDGLDDLRLGMVEGFDVSPFNRLMHLPLRLSPDDSRVKLASPAATLLALDFAGGGPFLPGQSAIDLTATAPANGVVQWIRLELDDEAAYENAPGHGDRHSWSLQFRPFHPGASGAAGEAVRVHLSHMDSTLRIWTGPASG